MIKIRKTNFQDYPQLKQLILEALKEDPKAFTVKYSEYSIGSEDWWHNFLDPYLLNNKSQMYVAEDNDTICGMIGVLYSNRAKQSHIATIVWFYISQSYRGRKIGKTLFDKVLNGIEANKNIRKVSLNVSQTQSSAISIYEKYGFKSTGTLQKELFDDGEFIDVFVMEKLLD